ncbi:MAG: hypothetical protein EKK64_03430 [Neisseriaceae bacterium]|nr:MAG: hypothetical protein EKK64_03430 [Neisseriaceae bacterium]
MFKKMSLLAVAFSILAVSAYAGEEKACCENACRVKKHRCEKCCVCEVSCKAEKCCVCETKCVQKCRCKKTKCCCTNCCCETKCKVSCCETKCKCKVKKERKCCLIPVCKVRCCIFDIFKPKCCVPCENKIETETEKTKPEAVPVEPTPVATIIWGRGIIRSNTSMC